MAMAHARMSVLLTVFAASLLGSPFFDIYGNHSVVSNSIYMIATPFPGIAPPTAVSTLLPATGLKEKCQRLSFALLQTDRVFHFQSPPVIYQAEYHAVHHAEYHAIFSSWIGQNVRCYVI